VKRSAYLTAVTPEPGTIALHSGMSGNVMMVPAAAWSRVEAFCDGDDDGEGIEEQLEALVRGRFITTEDVDELAVLRSRYLQSRFAGPLGLTVVTSLGCNFDCPYCFEDKTPSKLKSTVRDAILRIVEDSPADLPSVNVTWMGGEPLVGSDELFDLSARLIALCEQRGYDYSAGIITNGWYLDATMAKRLSAHKVKNAQVTIDGPPDIHNRYRPHLNGSGTYQRVIDNVEAAAHHINVSVRININRENLGRVEELIADLAQRGLGGEIGLGAARMTNIVANPEAPVATYDGACFSATEFARVEIEFDRLASRYGFLKQSTPSRVGTPCTAVRATDLVVGSDGELWKCWDDIGDATATIGSVFDYQNAGGEHLDPWLSYDPFSDPHCSTCFALPGCMGGCAHHLFNSDDPTERCGAFRGNHTDRVLLAAQATLGHDVGDVELPLIAGCAPRGVPVSLSAKRPVALI
jgi:uncharacterized protein